jgi:hypothetical protein
MIKTFDSFDFQTFGKKGFNILILIVMKLGMIVVAHRNKLQKLLENRIKT